MRDDHEHTYAPYELNPSLSFCTHPKCGKQLIVEHEYRTTMDNLDADILAWRDKTGEMLRVLQVAHLIGQAVITLPPPYRHHNLFSLTHDLYEAGNEGLKHEPRNSEHSGFLLTNGKYADRSVAATLALRNGQVKKLISAPHLYSEDLF